MRRMLGPLLWMLSLLAACCWSFWMGRHSVRAQAAVTVVQSSGGSTPQASGDSSPPPATLLYAHNLLLRKGAHFRAYIPWIRGQIVRTKRDQNPSFDEPDSFLLDIQKGVIQVKLKDISEFLNANTSGQTPLKNVSIQSVNGQLQLTGTVHKLVALPVQVDGLLSPMPDGRLKYHLVKLDLLHLPLKGLLGVFHVGLSDLVSKIGTPGVEIAGNDIYFDTQRLLPPPHLHGPITSVTASDTELKLVYGGAKDDEERLAQWHNFLRLTGGSLDFGKLTMRQVDLTMIDASQDPWFDLDLVNYQAQLVYGTTRMTAKAGLEIYMPDVDELPAKKAVQAVSLEWLRNRHTSPPLNVPEH